MRRVIVESADGKRRFGLLPDDLRHEDMEAQLSLTPGAVIHVRLGQRGPGTETHFRKMLESWLFLVRRMRHAPTAISRNAQYAVVWNFVRVALHAFKAAHRAGGIQSTSYITPVAIL